MIAKIKQLIKANALKRRLKSLKIKKLNIGAGPDGSNKEYEDWISIDKEILDITDERNWLSFVGMKSSIDNILAEHVWEHLTEEQTELANQNCFNFLKKEGRLRIAVPDGFFPNQEYIDQVKPGGSGIGSDDHKILYTHETMQRKLEKVGFKVEKVEYYDHEGKFHKKDWDEKQGFIKRSLEKDKRNKSGHIGYTSLIVDAIKE